MPDEIQDAFYTLNQDLLLALAGDVYMLPADPHIPGMLAAPVLLLAVLWLGRSRVPAGKQLNGAGWVMLTGLGLLLGWTVAMAASGPFALFGWMYSELAHHTAHLLLVLGGTTALAGGILRLAAPRELPTGLAAGSVLALAGALCLKGLEVMAFADNNLDLAAAVSPMSHAALLIAGLYLLGALFVLLRMPRRAAPMGGVLLLLALVALVTGWSMPSAPEPLLLFGQEVRVEDSAFPDNTRRWAVYHPHVFAVIEVGQEH